MELPEKLKEKLDQYVLVPTHLLLPGRPLKSHLYLWLPLNDRVVLYRALGQSLTEDEVVALRERHYGALLIPRGEHRELMSQAAAAAASEIQLGRLDSPTVKSVAVSLMRSLDLAPPRPRASAPATPFVGKVSPEMLQAVSNAVEELVVSVAPTANLDAYEKELKKIAASASDPLSGHQQQVSCVAILIQLAHGGYTPEELVDLGIAGLIHDIGLAQLSPKIRENYLQKKHFLLPAELERYRTHAAFAREMKDTFAAGISDRVVRTIEQHHENWDGSGFRGTLGPSIAPAARILRIADEIVGMINHPGYPTDFREAIARINADSGTHFDPSVVRSLCRRYGEQTGITDLIRGSAPPMPPA